MKVKGSNMSRPKIYNLHPKDKVYTVPFFKGDLVQIMRGKDEGKQGTITEIIKKHNMVSSCEGDNSRSERISLPKADTKVFNQGCKWHYQILNPNSRDK
jgi:ribosomal protein L24